MRINTTSVVMPAARTDTVNSFIAMEILARARKLEQEGANVIHLELGEPDFETPPSVVAAAKDALENGFTHYTVALGDQSLREAIARHYSLRYGVCVSPERVVIFPGSSPALGMLFSFLLPTSRVSRAAFPSMWRHARKMASSTGQRTCGDT